MRRRGFRTFLGCMCFGGFLWAFGALGSLDRGVMDLGRGILNIALGIAVCGAAWVALELTD